MKKSIIAFLMMLLVGIIMVNAVCTDSDNGKNYNIKGTLIYTSLKYSDYCFGNKYVAEFYCLSERPYMILNYCSNGCSNGACKETLCGNSLINTNEQCELPNTNNNKYCVQTQTSCLGKKEGTRDTYGDCSLSCGCSYDSFNNYQCVKGHCNAECSSNIDCDDNNLNTEDICSADCGCSNIQILNSKWLYQETADVLWQTQGNSKWKDGNWTSYTMNNGLNFTTNIEYNKPNNANINSLWQVKVGINKVTTYNLSINSTCWNYNTSSLQFRTRLWYAGFNYVYVECLSPNGWVTMLNGVGDYLYEEAMWWNTE
jgi:hypothetical protein